MNILKHNSYCGYTTLPVVRIPRNGEGNVKDKYVIYSDGNIIFNKTSVNFTCNSNKTDEFLELLCISHTVENIRYSCVRDLITNEGEIFHKIVSELNNEEISLWKQGFATV